MNRRGRSPSYRFGTALGGRVIRNRRGALLVSIDYVRIILLGVALCVAQCADEPAAAAECFVYIGTQSEAPGAGISVARFDSETGILSEPRLAVAADGPSYFAVSGDGQHLYSTNYTGAGGVSAYAIDRESGGLKLLNRIEGGHFGTSHVSLDGSGKWLLAANFDHGQVAVFPVFGDGSLGAACSLDRHTGSSINPVRQKGTYPHCVLVDPSDRFALVPDLGLDKFFVYRFDESSGKLTANEPGFAAIEPGSGPRHFRFSPNGKWVYLLNEMGSRIDAFSWERDTGRLFRLQSISMLPGVFQGENTAAEIVIGRDGRFLYASNRGDDSIVVYAIDQVTGRLTVVQRAASRGRT